MHFRFLGLPSILLRLSIMSTPIKAKRNTWPIKRALFFIIMRQMRVFVITEDSPIFIKKVFKILPLWQIMDYPYRNFETRTMLDCRCYGQHSHENESGTEIRREPFIRTVFVLDKTCSYKWYSSRLI